MNFSNKFFRNLAICLLAFFSFASVFVSNTKLSAESVQSNAVMVYVRPQVTCSASSTSLGTGGSTTWTATVLPAGPAYTYSWNVPGGTFVSAPTTNSATYSYSTSGTYTASVTVTPPSLGADPNGVTAAMLATTVTCGSNVVVADPFNYSLSNSGNLNIVTGNSGSNVISTTLLTGTSQVVNLSMTSAPALPASIVPSWTTNTATPSVSKPLSFNVGATAPVGSSYTITITGSTAGLPNKTTTFTLTISGVVTNPTANISASPNPVSYGATPNIAWSSSNATACSATSANFSTTFAGVPNAALGVNPGVAQTTPTTYTVTCTGAIGTPPASASVSVPVLPEQPAPLLSPSPSCAATGSPVSMIVTWPSAALATSYKLHRSTSGSSGSYGQLPIGAPTSVTSPYVDSGLTAGTYYYQLQAVNAAGSSYSVPVSIIVPVCPPSFDYRLLNSGSITVNVGSSGSNTIIRELISGTTQGVSLSVSGLPSNTTSSFSPGSANPQSPAAAAGNSTLTINTTSLTPIGSYTITVTGAPLGRTTTFTLNVVPAPPDPVGHISASPNPVSYGGTPNIAWYGDYSASCLSLSGNFSTTFSGVPNSVAGTNPGVAQTSPVNYTVSCSGVGGYNPSSVSVNVNVTPQKPTLNAPSPSAACASNSAPVNMILSWSNATLATSYKLHRSTSGSSGSYGQLPIGAPTSVTSPYVDSGLTAGTYYYQLQAVNAAGSSYSDPVAIIVPSCPPPFDYNLSNSGNIAVVVGSSGSNTIIRNLTSGTTQPVSLSITSGLPANTSYTILPASANPQSPAAAVGNSTLTITTTALTLPGSYTIVVTGAPLGRTTTFTLTVSGSAVNPIAYISGSPNPVAYGGTPNISWHGDYATSCTSLSGNFTTMNGVPNATNGTNPGIAQTTPTNYTVSCSGTPGSTPASASVNVTVKPQRPTMNPPSPSPSCADAGSPVSVIITWPDAALATSYKIHRSYSGASGSYGQLPLGSPTSVASPFVDSNLSAGTYYYQLEAVNASGSSYSNPSAIIIPSCSGFDYRLAATPTVNVIAGNSVTNTISVNYVSGTTESVTLSVPVGSPLPAGVTLQSFSPGSCNPGATKCNIVMTLNTLPTTVENTYTITVHGVSQTTNVAQDTTFALTVSGTGGPGGGLTVSCTASPINVDLANNRSVTWTANVTNGTPPFTYTWSGDFPLAPDSPASTPSRTKTKTITYVDDVVNPKKGYITVIDSSDPVLSANSYQCPSTVDVVDTSRTPDFSITATPKVSMNFVGSSATSNIINVTISPIDGFSNDVALSGGPSSINVNGVDYPLTYEFYNHDTLDLNSTVANFRYGAGLDMVVKSSSQIPVGNYQVTVTGTSGTLVHTKQVILEVGTVRPIFQEF